MAPRPLGERPRRPATGCGIPGPGSARCCEGGSPHGRWRAHARGVDALVQGDDGCEVNAVGRPTGTTSSRCAAGWSCIGPWLPSRRACGCLWWPAGCARGRTQSAGAVLSGGGGGGLLLGRVHQSCDVVVLRRPGPRCTVAPGTDCCGTQGGVARHGHGFDVVVTVPAIPAAMPPVAKVWPAACIATVSSVADLLCWRRTCAWGEISAGIMLAGNDAA